MTKSIRLNDNIREKLLAMVLADSFDEWEKRVKEAEGLAACMVYDYIYPADVRKKMAALPRSAFWYKDGLAVKVEKAYVAVGDDGQEVQRLRTVFPETELAFGTIGGGEDGAAVEIISKPMFYAHSSRWYYHTHILQEEQIPAEILSTLLEVQKKRQDYRNAYSSARSDLIELFNSATTIKRLREVWPEGSYWLDKIQPPAPPPMVVDLSALNSLLCEASMKKVPCCPPAEQQSDEG